MANNEKLLVIIKSAWNNILAFKDEKNKFNEEFMQFVPEVKKYIVARLKSSVNTEKLPENKYKVDDFIDELFISAYDNIEQFDSPENYYIWLIQKVDELLEDISIEEEFNEFFFKNIDNYTYEEWDAMEEEYTTGADGNFILTEDIDDDSYAHHEYVLKDVFIDNSSDELINKISDKLSAEQIQRHIDMIVNKLSFDQQIIFQQSALLGSSLSQIAKVRSVDTKQIEDNLKMVRLTIQNSFITRFSL